MPRRRLLGPICLLPRLQIPPPPPPRPSPCPPCRRTPPGQPRPTSIQLSIYRRNSRRSAELHRAPGRPPHPRPLPRPLLQVHLVQPKVLRQRRCRPRAARDRGPTAPTRLGCPSAETAAAAAAFPSARARVLAPVGRSAAAATAQTDDAVLALSLCACVSSEWRPFLPREFIDGLRCWKIGKNRRLRRNSRLPSGFRCAAGVQRRSKIPLFPLCKVFTSHDAIWPLLLLEYEANKLISKNLTLSCGLFSFDLCLPCSKCSLYPLHFLCLQGRNSLFAFSL